MDRHLAFASLPAHGHVLPTLPVVSELVRRGWRVSYATGERFREEVETAGASLVPTGAESPDVLPLTLPGPAFAAFLHRVVADARATLPVLTAHFRDDPPRAVCFDAMSLGGRILAAETAAADVALLPAFASNEHSSPFARRQAALPPEVLAILREMAALAAAHGVELQRGRGVLAPAGLNLVFVPPEFQPDADTFDGRFRFVGPSPAFREDDPAWTPPDEPVVYVSLGTAFNDRPDFYRACFAAFGGGGPVAMAVGKRVRIGDLGPVPTNIDVRPWFPQPAVLRSASAFVTHAGMGSTMEALYYGVPLVCVPQMFEQEVNARRVSELGLGVVVEPDGATAERLRTAVDAVTTDGAMRDALDRMRVATRAAGGAVAAAHAIEAHLAAWTPPAGAAREPHRGGCAEPAVSPASPPSPPPRRP